MGESKMYSEYLLVISIIFSIHSQVTLALEDEISQVIWTDVAEASLLTEDEHKVAFRDVVIESVVRRMFNVFMQSSKQWPAHSNFPNHLLLKDPQVVQENISFKKKTQGLVDIDFKAWNLKISGLHDIKIKNLHVLRHIGLKDIRVVVQLVTDLKITGEYKLQGTGLSMLPLTGSGQLNVAVSQLLLTGESFLIVRENNSTKGTDMDVKLENLLGGGLVGNAANDVLKLVGEDLLYSHKDVLVKTVREVFKNEISKFIDV